MSAHHKVSYLEIPVRDLEAVKAFFGRVFGWEFLDYGPEYASFSAGIDGGFSKADAVTGTPHDGPLVVLYSEDLEQTQAAVEAAGGRIVRSIFEFPGGRRFHFVAPGGGEFAVWGDAARP